MRQFVGFFVEAVAFVAAEAVAGAGVDVDFHLGLRRFDRVDVGHRDAAVGFAEVHLHRAVGFLVLGLGDAAAVPARRRLEFVRARCAKPRHRSAVAVADDAGRRGAERLRRGDDVLDRLVVGDLAARFDADFAIVGTVADIDAFLGAVEHRRCDDLVAGGAEAVGHAADVMVYAEDLLDDHDPLRGVCRPGGVSPERVVVGGGERRCSHESPILVECNAGVSGTIMRSARFITFGQRRRGLYGSRRRVGGRPRRIA